MHLRQRESLRHHGVRARGDDDGPEGLGVEQRNGAFVRLSSREGEAILDEPAPKLGDLKIVLKGRRALDVIAVEPTLVASISPETFMRLLHAHPPVVERLLRRLVRLLRATSERVIDLSTLGVQNRIHADILRLAIEAGVHENTARLEPAPRHTDIAGRVSTNREQVTREMSALAKAGLLAKDGTALLLRDVTRLARMVEEVRGTT